MSVIEASSAGVKDMADGSLRITLEFEPRHAKDAYALFGARGTAVAVAALKDGSAAVTEKHVSETPKGGEWAKLAGIWCNDPDFWSFWRHQFGEEIQDAGRAAASLRYQCGIESRAELDHRKQAFDRFDAEIRRPFMDWMQARGITK